MGKMPAPFDIESFDLIDAYGNELNIPKCTAIALFTSSLSILKASVDINMMRIHLNEGAPLGSLGAKAFIYMPFFVATGLFRLSALSLILTYLNYWTVIIVATIIVANLVYGYKK